MNKRNLVDVSFCLPVYNVGKYLEDCIRSIVSQPFNGTTYEIICVDDCSTDDSYEILTDLAEKYQQITVCQNEQNKGVSYSRNRLLDLAAGEYIWFVDPDDMLITGAASYVQKAKERQADVLLGNYVRIGEDGSCGADLSDNHFDEDAIACTDRFQPVDAQGTPMSACWAGVFRRDFLIENALRFNEKMIAQEDTLFYYLFPLRTKRIYKSQKYCYMYRIRSDSVMHARTDERMKKYYFSMLEMLRVYQRCKANKEYTSEKLIDDRILHSRQNVATCLASVQDDAFVAEQLRHIKREGIYPYPFRTAVFKGEGNFLLKVLKFLMPIEMVFHMYRYIYRHRAAR